MPCIRVRDGNKRRDTPGAAGLCWCHDEVVACTSNGLEENTRVIHHHWPLSLRAASFLLFVPPPVDHFGELISLRLFGRIDRCHISVTPCLNFWPLSFRLWFLVVCLSFDKPPLSPFPTRSSISILAPLKVPARRVLTQNVGKENKSCRHLLRPINKSRYLRKNTPRTPVIIQIYKKGV